MPKVQYSLDNRRYSVTVPAWAVESLGWVRGDNLECIVLDTTLIFFKRR